MKTRSSVKNVINVELFIDMVAMACEKPKCKQKLDKRGL